MQYVTQEFHIANIPYSLNVQYVLPKHPFGLLIVPASQHPFVLPDERFREAAKDIQYIQCILIKLPAYIQPFSNGHFVMDTLYFCQCEGMEAVIMIAPLQ